MFWMSRVWSYEIRMSEEESLDEFYTKLNDIVNSAYNLGEIYDQPKIIRKILRSLTEDFRPIVTAKNFRNFLRNNNRRAKV